MTATTQPQFGEHTEALEVAKAFPGSVTGKTVIVTGVNLGGIGFTTAQAFSPAHLIIAGRTPSKIQSCIDALKADYPNVDYRILRMELSSQESVRAGARELLSWTDVPVVDILVNNAAIAHVHERELTEDGIEKTFATNHVGHFLFTVLIMPKLLQAAKSGPKGSTRVINVTSLSPLFAVMRWSDINFDKVNKDLPVEEQPPFAIHKLWGFGDTEEMSYVSLEGYNQSKVANVLFSIALNNRLYEKYGILSFACHPGIIRTELSRNATDSIKTVVKDIMENGRFGTVKTLGAGASTTVVAALDPKLGMPKTREEDGKENYGVYFIDCQISDRNNAKSSSSSEADRLWKLSEELVKESFAW